MNTFHSTRSHQQTVTAKQAIRTGIASDGGLFVNDALGTAQGPHIDIASLAGQSYQEIAQTVLGALLPDFSEQELRQCIQAAYSEQWDDQHITPLKPLGDDWILELFHGPTSAFKDVALQILPQFMAYTADTASESSTQASATSQQASKTEHVHILTATSGDTGKAALAGFADVPGTGITVFYPEGKVSQIQQLQMTTQPGANVHVYAVRGNFDDAQSAVKRIFADRELAQELQNQDHVMLSSANSINVGRLVPQVVYYFAAYMQLVERGAITLGDPVEFVVPTGNFGNILAGYYAKLLGLPVAHLTVASDTNNVLVDFLNSGVYDRNRPFYQTTSPSMDILISSNLERMLYYFSDKNEQLIRSLMQDLAQDGTYQIPQDMLTRIQSLFSADWASEDEVDQAIAECYQRTGEVIDPHTACGYTVMQRSHKHGESVARVLLATASPYKFPRVVNKALGLAHDDSDFACMDVLSEHTNTQAPAALRNLETTPERFSEVITIEQMPDAVRRASQEL